MHWTFGLRKSGHFETRFCGLFIPPLTELEILSTRYQELLHRERGSEQALVETYRAILSQLEHRWKRLSPTVELPLTILQVFGRGGDENFISNYLAYILNPKINGIGTAPLEKFLELCSADDFDLPWDEFSIEREKTLDEGRIDLLLTWENVLVVGIENKIYSSEHDQQTLRYAKDISEQFKGVPRRLIYLTRDAQKPASHEFHPLSYAQLVEAFRTVQVSPEIGLRKYLLWQDFLEHLEVYIIMSDPEKFEFSEKARLYMEHHIMIDDLKSAFQNEYGKAINWLENQLVAYLNDPVVWKTKFNPTTYYWHYFCKSAWQTSQLFVHFEYWFSAEQLIKGEIDFMIDAEGKAPENFLASFDQRYLSLQSEYEKREIKYRPQNRRVAIAWKTYPITQNIQEIAKMFIAAFEEFRFLVPEIDQVIAELAENKK